MNGKKSVSRVVVSTMNPRERHDLTGSEEAERSSNHKIGTKRARTKGNRARMRVLPKHLPALAAAVCCLGIGAYAAVREGSVSAVMSHLTAGFEYDETLGRLQFVRNVLPESAMVFLEGVDAEPEFLQPASGEVLHVWSEAEPWLEYGCFGEVSACMDGEVMTVVRNHNDAYTVRVMHENGYESLYSGLTGVSLRESDIVVTGQRIGDAGGDAAFELRKDGMSVQPVFAAL